MGKQMDRTHTIPADGVPSRPMGCCLRQRSTGAFVAENKHTGLFSGRDELTGSGLEMPFVPFWKRDCCFRSV